MGVIYCLKLEHGKYFVGSGRPVLSDHFKGKYPWTTMFKPIKILFMHKVSNPDEDYWTFVFMTKFGMDNVRGGRFSDSERSSCMSYMLRMFWGYSNAEKFAPKLSLHSSHRNLSNLSQLEPTSLETKELDAFHLDFDENGDLQWISNSI